MIKLALVFSTFVLLGGCATVEASRPLDAQAGSPSASRHFDHPPFWIGDLTPAERFERAKRSRPELIAFLRRMPKGGDLHNHISGATFGDFMLESALAAGKHYDLARDVFVDEPTDQTVPTQTLIDTPAYLNQYRDIISMRGWHRDSANGHDHFFRTFSHFGTAGRTSAEMLAEVLIRNAAQNIQYLELMAWPGNFPVLQRFLDASPSFVDVNDLDAAFEPFRALVDDPEVLAEFRTTVDAWEAIARAHMVAMNFDPDHAPPVRYVGSIMRTFDLTRFFVRAVVMMTMVKADERYVAVNILAPEDAARARMEFDDQMVILDYLWDELDQPNMTLHSGELTMRESPLEPMLDRIRKTIDIGHASRIGHGISIGWERDVVSLLEQMRADGVLVEINLTSNDGILGIVGDDHPFLMYRSAGVPMCFCTDDEGVNRSNLTLEYVRAVRTYDLGYEEVKDLTRNCLEYSYLEGESLFVERDYSRRRATAPASMKARVQLALEDEFDTFEASLAGGFRED